MSVVFVQPPPPPPPKKRKREREPEEGGVPKQRGLIATIFIGAVVVHIIALSLFGLFIVARQFAKPEAVFEVSLQVSSRKGQDSSSCRTNKTRFS